MSGLPIPPCTQTDSAFVDLSNSLGQSPCYVATALANACSPSGTALVFPPLNSSHPFYGGVSVGSSSNPCLCSTVFYSMISACSLCQTSSSLDWSSYSINCNNISFSSFPLPIPQQTSVPHYAYLDVKASNDFNLTAALLAGGPESSPVSSVISTTILVTSTSIAVVTVNATSTSSTMTASASLEDTTNGSFTQPTLTPTQTSSSAKGGANIGVIIGSIIGVGAFFALLVFAGWMLFRRKRGVTVQRLLSEHSLVNMEQHSRPNDGKNLLQNDGQYSLRSEGQHSFQDEERPPRQSGDQHSAAPKTDWDQYSLLDVPVRPNPLPPREDTGKEMEDTMAYASNE